MANLKASKQGIKVNERNRKRNKQLKTLLKSSLKNARLSVQSVTDATAGIVQTTCQLIDRMVTRGIIKKNTAARTKSRLMKALNQAASTQ